MARFKRYKSHGLVLQSTSSCQIHVVLVVKVWARTAGRKGSFDFTSFVTSPCLTNVVLVVKVLLVTNEDKQRERETQTVRQTDRQTTCICL